MHCHYGTNNRTPRWTFTDPCKPEVRPGAREESASSAWLAAPAMNTRDTKKVHIWRPDTGCGPTPHRKCHSHNTPGKKHNNTWVEPIAGYCTTSSSFQKFRIWPKELPKRFQKLVISVTLCQKCWSDFDHWRGFSTRNAHMVHIVNSIWLKMVYTS